MIPTTPIISSGMDALRLPAFFEDFRQCNRLAPGQTKFELMIPLIETDWMAVAFILMTTAFVYLGCSCLILSVTEDNTNMARCSDALLTRR